MTSYTVHADLTPGVAQAGLVHRTVTATPVGAPGPPATLASEAETDTGTNNTKAVSPDRLTKKLPYLDVAAYGAVGNGVTDDTASIQAALTAAGALVAGGGSIDRMMVPVVLRQGKHYRAVGLSVPYGTALIGNGSKIQAHAAGTIVDLVGHHSSIEDTCIWGAGGVIENLGVHVATTKTRCKIDHVTFNNLGGRAILCEGLTTWINEVMAQGCLVLADGLATPTGVLEINTTDCWVTNSEFTASRSALSLGGFAYAVVLKGGTHMLSNVIAEISDGGFHIASTRTSLNGCRADLNRGHGYVLAASSGGTLNGCLSLSNGIETNNTYDGYNFGNASHWSVSDCRVAWAANAIWNPAGNKARYGFNDVVQSASFFNKFSSTNFVEPSSYITAPLNVQLQNGSKVDPHAGPFTLMTANVTTWNVQTWGWPQSRWRLNANVATNFTDFTNEVSGMELAVLGDGQTTFVHNAAVLKLLGGANLLATLGTLYRFINVDGVWHQV